MDIQLNESKTAKNEGNNTNWFFSKYTVWVMVCGVSSKDMCGYDVLLFWIERVQLVGSFAI